MARKKTTTTLIAQLWDKAVDLEDTAAAKAEEAAQLAALAAKAEFESEKAALHAEAVDKALAHSGGSRGRGMTEVIPTEKVTEAIRKIVAETPDFVYKGHSGGRYGYADEEGNPSCLVGCVLAEVAPDLLARLHEGEKIADESATFSLTRLARLGVYELPFEWRTIRALGRAQGAQDAAAPWWAALDAYLVELKREVGT